MIVALNSEPVDSIEQMKAVVERSRDRVAVLVQRNATRFFVPVPLG